MVGGCHAAAEHCTHQGGNIETAPHTLGGLRRRGGEGDRLLLRRFGEGDRRLPPLLRGGGELRLLRSLRSGLRLRGGGGDLHCH